MQHPCSSPCRAGNFLPAGEELPEATPAAAAGDGSCSTRFSLSFSPSGPMLSARLHPALKHQAGCSPERCCYGCAFWGLVQPRGLCRGGEGWKRPGHPPGWLTNPSGWIESLGITSCPPFPTWGLVPIPRTSSCSTPKSPWRSCMCPQPWLAPQAPPSALARCKPQPLCSPERSSTK